MYEKSDIQFCGPPTMTYSAQTKNMPHCHVNLFPDVFGRLFCSCNIVDNGSIPGVLWNIDAPHLKQTVMGPI